jgi:flagellar biosynthesis protein FlhF
VELFVGPPGAGKTTTIAKIAARERARRGQRLSLLAADGFRVGAVEQLRLYADLIGSPFAVARTPAEIERSLASTRSPILVDTAGRSLGDARALEVAERLSSLPGVRTHVVLPAGTSPRQAARLLDAYGDRARRVVLTRLDEGESVAPLLKLIAARDLTLSYLGTGQRVPDDLERASAAALARHILGPDGPEGLPA